MRHKTFDAKKRTKMLSIRMTEEEHRFLKELRNQSENPNPSMMKWASLRFSEVLDEYREKRRYDSQ